MFFESRFCIFWFYVALLCCALVHLLSFILRREQTSRDGDGSLYSFSYSDMLVVLELMAQRIIVVTVMKDRVDNRGHNSVVFVRPRCGSRAALPSTSKISGEEPGATSRRDPSSGRYRPSEPLATV